MQPSDPDWDFTSDRVSATLIRAMPSKFRPCIDLHDGVVKQIVGATLSDSSPESLRTNFIAK